MQLEIRLKPDCELTLDHSDETFERLEVHVVRAQPTSQFPDALHRVQVGAVRGQEVQPQLGAVFVEPGLQGSCVMPASVVDDDHQPARAASPAQQLPKEHLETVSVVQLR